MNSARDWSETIHVLNEQLTRYLFPDVAARIRAVLTGRLAAGAYAGLADERAFADAVTADMRSVNGDQHLYVSWSEQEIPAGQSTVDESALLAGQAVLTGHGFARVERLPGNVGLLDIRALYDPAVAGAGTAAAAAMNLVAGADVLLLDLRECRGGEPEMAALVASYLFDRRTHLVDLRFPAEDRTVQYWTDTFVPGPAFGGTKPVYVLVGGRTISGGEGVAYQLQQSGRGTLVGERTAGAANFHYPYRLTAHLMSAIPTGYPVDPVSGKHWEGTGVQPDIPVPVAGAFPTAYRLALEHVLTLGEAGARAKIAAAARQALAGLPS